MDLSVSAGTRKVEVPPEPGCGVSAAVSQSSWRDVARYVNAIPYGPADANELLRQKTFPKTGQSATPMIFGQRSIIWRKN